MYVKIIGFATGPNMRHFFGSNIAELLIFLKTRTYVIKQVTCYIFGIRRICQVWAVLPAAKVRARSIFAAFLFSFLLNFVNSSLSLLHWTSELSASLFRKAYFVVFVQISGLISAPKYDSKLVTVIKVIKVIKW